MPEEALSECTATIEAQVLDFGEPSADEADAAGMPEPALLCLPPPAD